VKIELADKQHFADTISEGPPAHWFALLEALSPAKVVMPLVLVAILARLLFIFAAAGIGDPNSMDAQNYLLIARNLAEGRGFVIGSEPTVFVAPLYPAVIAGLQLLFGESIWVIKVFQAILGGVSVWLIYLLGGEIFRRQVAYIAAALFAFHPEMIALAAFIYTEVLFIFLLLLTLLFITKAVKTGKRSSFLLAGLLLGVTNLCRGTVMYFPGFLFLLLLFYRNGLWLRRMTGAVLLTVAMALTMLPWAARNYIHFKAFIPVAAGSGDVFWTGNYLPFDGEFRYEETQKAIQRIVGRVSWIERDRILMAEAKKNILENPAASAWLFIRKIFRYWFRVYENVPSGQARETNWLIFAALGFTHFALLALAIAGLRQANLREPIIAMMLILFFYYTVIHAVTLAVPRYRQPLIPAICIFAAAGLLAIGEKWHSSRRIEER
jgi:4-amino-4-deoxy-L-arabinose transferase-like glycosyltransferase